jgi:penicillin amidase
LIDVHKVTTFEEFRGTFREWPVTPQHFVYADTSGTIGWQLTGEAPVRKKGWGTMPRSGADPDAGWSGLVPFEEMPHATNSPHGYYVTANNPPLPEDEGPYLGYDWVNGYRAAAITEALEARSDWDVAGSMRVQQSRKSKPWDEIRDVVLAAPATDPDARRGIALLRGWDGQVTAESAAASVYVLFLCELAVRAARAKAPHGYEWALGKGFGGLVPHNLFADRRFGHLVKLIRTRPPGWFARPWPDEIAEAIGAAVRRLEKASGRRAEDAAWGDVRPLTFEHLVFGKVSLLGQAFNRGPFPGGGDSNTPFQSTVQPLEPMAAPSYMPNLRMAIDVGEWSNSRFELAGGQSGNPLSPHYADLLELWRRGDGVPIPWAPEEIEAATVETLLLDPANASTHD